MPTTPSLPDLDEALQNFKQSFPSLSRLPDYVIFSAFCANYFFYDSTTAPFEAVSFLDCIPDGANDGGIDAIFVNPNDENEVIIAQSKLYSDSTAITPERLKTELNKISVTIKKMREGRTSEFSSKLVSAFQNACCDYSGDARDIPIQVSFFTSWQPESARKRNKLSKICDDIPSDANVVFRIFFKDDIQRKIFQRRQASLFIEECDLKLDRAGNALHYADSVIVNVSAKSIKQLYSLYGTAALALNLRYHIKGTKVARTVDKEVTASISNNPTAFWYKNNGILFACKSFSLDGDRLHLEQFSIVNGGQTTFLIFSSDITDDFFVPCKIVKAVGASDDERNKFCHEMAKATNSQKPISMADLRANSSEQLALHAKLYACGVYYVTKAGDSTGARSRKRYQIAKLEKVGKLGAACMLLRPGSARSSVQQMVYQDTNYWKIFKNPPAQFIADLLKLEFYYESFRKSVIARGASVGFSPEAISMTANGTLCMLACFAFVTKLHFHVFTWLDFESERSKDNEHCYALVEKMGSLSRMFATPTLPDEESVVKDLFNAIVRKVFTGTRTMAYKMTQETMGKEFNVSNYLKSDSLFYNYILQDLWESYSTNESNIKGNFDRLFS